MKDILARLNYKQQQRIAILNADDNFVAEITNNIDKTETDREIDPKYPYSFMIVCVKTDIEVENLTSTVLHNLVADGTLWFCYPKKDSKDFYPALDRYHGWKTLNASGFYGTRVVTIDDNWSAIRFRNEKFIKPKDKYGK
jgi:hypothetical protein